MTRARILAVGLLEHVRRHDWRCARHRSRRRPLRPSAEPPTLSGKDISEATLLIRVLAASLLIALGSSSLTALEVSNVVLLPTRLRVSRPHSQPADRIRTARKRSNASLDALPTEMEGLAACRGAPDARSPRRVFLTRIEKLNAAPQCSDASANMQNLRAGHSLCVHRRATHVQSSRHPATRSGPQACPACSPPRGQAVGRLSNSPSMIDG